MPKKAERGVRAFVPTLVQRIGRAAAPADPGAWPFEDVPAALFDRLTERQKGMVEAVMKDRIKELLDCAARKRRGDIKLIGP